MSSSKNNSKPDLHTLTYDNSIYRKNGNHIRYNLPKDDDDAKARSNIYADYDPFLNIAPALLNSVDIANYVSKTGMVFPFYPELLKTASYGVRMLGRVTYWNIDNANRHSFSYDAYSSILNRIDCETVYLNLGDEFKLKPNSIAFVELEPTFRLPSYIAIRFNLTIKNVYKGLLLGTGPLIDPGFCGKIYIPLHNLTTNEYTFHGGDDLIWVEFTKLSPHKAWSENKEYKYLKNEIELVEFKVDKKNKDLDYYLDKGPGRDPVLSSMGPLNLEFKKISNARRIMQFKINFTLIAIFITIVGIFISGAPLIHTLFTEDNSAKIEIIELQHELEALKSEQKAILKLLNSDKFKNRQNEKN